MEKRVNIELKETTHKKAKMIAALKGINLSKFLEESIEKAVKAEQKTLEEVIKK